jgi:hypothetical protein
VTSIITLWFAAAIIRHGSHDSMPKLWYLLLLLLLLLCGLQGEPSCVAQAVFVITAAVDRYKELCEGKYSGECYLMYPRRP